MIYPSSSGPNDHIFVNFVDHGAPGILAFPDEMVSLTRGSNSDIFCLLIQKKKVITLKE